MSPQLEALLKQAQGLSPREQLELIECLTGQVSTQPEIEARPKRKATEFYGVACNLLSGMDAKTEKQRQSAVMEELAKEAQDMGLYD